MLMAVTLGSHVGCSIGTARRAVCSDPRGEAGQKGLAATRYSR
jgi:hypothetical protein